MKLIIHNKYGVAPHNLLNNPEISLKAKGMYTFIQSKPTNWSFSVEKIALQTRDGEASIRSALQELEEHGYLHRQKFQNEKGHWCVEYHLFESPLDVEILPRNSKVRKSEGGKVPKHSNKDLVRRNSNKDTGIPFVDFWKIYPNKSGKALAEKKWNMISDDQTKEYIIKHVEKRKYMDLQWSRGYIPHASTFLNGKRWEDEYDVLVENDNNSVLKL